jgi:hypothetical protein
VLVDAYHGVARLDRVRTPLRSSVVASGAPLAIQLVGLPGFEPGRETPVLGFFGPSSGLGEHTGWLHEFITRQVDCFLPGLTTGRHIPASSP